MKVIIRAVLINPLRKVLSNSLHNSGSKLLWENIFITQLQQHLFYSIPRNDTAKHFKRLCLSFLLFGVYKL